MKYLITCCICFFCTGVFSQQKTILFTNGYWYNGNSFEPQTFYSVNGLLTKTKPGTVDTIIDLKQQYIIPPFGEAHNHSPDTEIEFDIFNERYLSDGVFYIKNPNSIPFTTQKIAHRINQPGSVDVVFANGGLTGSGGHPVPLYKYMIETRYKEAIKGWTYRSMEGNAYYIIDSKEDLEKKWPFILNDKPGFIKVYLLNSEEYEQRKNDTLYNGRKGMNPKLLQLVVSKAHSAGLKVSCHIETPKDVWYAVKAGVDEINHLPGYQVLWKEGYPASYYTLTSSLVRKMKKKGVHADPTYSLAATELIETDSVQYRMRRQVQQQNLRLLKRFAVPLTIASDSYNQTSKTEAEYLYQLGVYTNRELLNMWCITTPQVIFPDRKIAALQEGYEASFLVLKENPLEHFQTVFKIQLRVKQGKLLW